MSPSPKSSIAKLVTQYWVLDSIRIWSFTLYLHSQHSDPCLHASASSCLGMLRQDVEQTHVQVLGLGYSLDLGPLCTVALNPKPFVLPGFVYHLRAEQKLADTGWGGAVGGGGG